MTPKDLIVSLLMLLPMLAGSACARDVDEAAKTVIEANAAGLIATFKQFHRNPELSYQEIETSRTIAAHLEQLGYPVTTGVGGTGVVSVL